VADQVDAAVNLMEPSVSKSELDLSAGDAGVQQLPPGNYPVLPSGESRDYAIRESAERLGTHTVPNPTFV
jgi:hypothetical protein